MRGKVRGAFGCAVAQLGAFGCAVALPGKTQKAFGSCRGPVVRLACSEL